MRRLPTAAFAILLTACTTATSPSARSVGADAGATRDCLDTQRIAGQRAEGPRTILFETAGGRWRNTLPEACPGLDRPSTFVTLVFEPKIGPLCRNDFVRAVDSNQLATLGASTFPRCRLGRFTRVPPRG